MAMGLKKSKTLQIILLSLSVVIFAFSMIAYRLSLTRIMKSLTWTSLEETTKLYTALFDLKIQENFDLLDAIAEGFSYIDTTNDKATTALIQHFSNKTDFSTLYFADEDGETFGNEGQSFGNVSKTDYFRRTMFSGTRTISRTLATDSRRFPSFILSVPVIKNDKPCGMVCGIMNLLKLNNTLSAHFKNSKGFFMIVESNGHIIFTNAENKNQFGNNFNIFLIKNKCCSESHFMKYSEDLRNQKEGLMEYYSNGARRFCSYTPLNMNNWYLLTIIKTDDIDARISVTKKISTGLSAIMSVLLILSIVLILLAERKTELVKTKNEGLTKIYDSNKSVVLDINLLEKSISYSGDTNFVFGKSLQKTDYANFAEFTKNIHKDDKHVIKELKKAAFENFTEYTAEFRLMCSDGEYNWFRVKNLPIFDEDHKPVRSLASFTNVNKQMLKEQELMHKAEYDSLSGLLNKGSFENKVSAHISKNTEQTCALLIIDLDNFKMINDTLGHSMGDAAISDTAKKISLIFSIQDYLGRIGGDEFSAFVIFDKNMPLSECIMHLNEKVSDLCEILNEMYFNEDKYVEISASIGISIYPEHGTSYEELFDRADNALYNVKKGGKNNFIIWNSDLQQGSESSYSSHKGLEELI